MKTAREKAEYWLNDNVAGWNEVQLKCLERLLKEQDRDTRHACADAVINLETVGDTESLISKDTAHNACMNVKVV